MGQCIPTKGGKNSGGGKKGRRKFWPAGKSFFLQIPKEAVFDILLFVDLNEYPTLFVLNKELNKLLNSEEFYEHFFKVWAEKSIHKSHMVILKTKYENWKERVKELVLTELPKQKDVAYWGIGEYISNTGPILQEFHHLFIGITKPLHALEKLVNDYREYSTNFDLQLNYEYRKFPTDLIAKKTYKRAVFKKGVDKANIVVNVNEHFIDFQKTYYENFEKYLRKVIKPWQKKKSQGVFLCFDLSMHYSFSKLEDVIKIFNPKGDHSFVLIGIDSQKGMEREIRYKIIRRFMKKYEQYDMDYLEVYFNDINDVMKRNSKVLPSLDKLKEEINQIFEINDIMMKKVFRRKLEAKNRKMLKVLKKAGLRIK